jgi:hypothetical protein
VEYVYCHRHTKSNAYADPGANRKANANVTEKPTGYPTQQNATDDAQRQCGFTPTRDFLGGWPVSLCIRHFGTASNRFLADAYS